MMGQYLRLLALIGKLAENANQFTHMSALQWLTVGGSALSSAAGVLLLRPHDYQAAAIAALGAVIVALGHLFQDAPRARAATGGGEDAVVDRRNSSLDLN